MQQHLKFLVQIEPRAMRPNFLLVIFNNDKLTCDVLQPIFNLSWSYKFLDFTIIQLNLYHGDITKQYIFYYNPFYNLCEKQILTKNTHIFPDKLVNLN